MALPKLQHPTFEVKIPSTQKSFIFRPYTVKEQKILLMLQDSKDPDELVRCIKDLIESCCQGDINADKLTYFDIEYIILKLRSKSVGEIANLAFKCTNTINAEDETESVCGATTKLDINLEDINVDFSKSKNKDILIQDSISIRMSYPSIKSAKLLEEYNSSRDSSLLIKAILGDISSISDKEKVYDDFTQEELIEFINSLDLKVFEQFLQFYINSPKLRKNVEFKCRKCGFVGNIVLEGLTDFFV